MSANVARYAPINSLITPLNDLFDNFRLLELQKAPGDSTLFFIILEAKYKIFISQIPFFIRET